MAFDSLSEKLQGVFKNLKSKGRLSEADVKAALKEVKMALLEADVNFKLLMIEMLNKSPLTRLNKFEQIKKHNWFKEFNWEALENLSLKPDITLKVNSKLDKKYANSNRPIINLKRITFTHNKFRCHIMWSSNNSCCSIFII